MALKRRPLAKNKYINKGAAMASLALTSQGLGIFAGASCGPLGQQEPRYLWKASCGS